MNADKVAKAIKAEFNVFCGACKDYYLWNPPPNVFDDKLRELRKNIEARIAELEAQDDSIEAKG